MGALIGRLGREDQRFWRKVSISETNSYMGIPCWEWTAANCKGYGRFGLQSDGPGLKCRVVVAHVWAYEYCIGPKPAGTELDHLCRNIRCVNPWHLEAVSPLINCYRCNSAPSVNAGKLYCKRGHPLSGENLVLLKNGWRECRSCLKMHRENSKNQTNNI